MVPPPYLVGASDKYRIKNQITSQEIIVLAKCAVFLAKPLSSPEQGPGVQSGWQKGEKAGEWQQRMIQAKEWQQATYNEDGEENEHKKLRLISVEKEKNDKRLNLRSQREQNNSQSSFSRTGFWVISRTLELDIKFPV